MSQRGQAVPNGGTTTTIASIITLLFPGFVNATGTDVMAAWLIFTSDFVLDDATTEIRYAAKGAPAASIGITLKKSVDNGATWTSIMSHTFSGHIMGPLTTTWTGGDLHAGDLLRVDITTADASCSGVMITVSN